MPAVRRIPRIDTFELKVEIEKRLGSKKAESYFNLVTKYLSLKLKKPEFDKLCVSLIGRENIRLHNELIMAILKNAVVSKLPPPKLVKSDGPVTLKAPNGTNPRTGLQSLCRDVFPPSPKKGRTPSLRERKLNNQVVNRSSDNMVTKKVQEQQQSVTELPLEVNSVEQDAISPGVYSRSPVRAPHGINLLHSKETRKVLSIGSDFAYHTETCHYSGHLPATGSLKNRLKQNLKTEGLDISMDCVKLLNDGLDCFLKRVIKPSLELTRSRSTQGSGAASFSTSMLDFRVSTEIHPMILGEVSHILHENNI
uniref:uncharacterized protein LOC122589476 n=1 Tax=Erigeron canadensis TaxID=72917 RepID=UPI001CB8FF33|nr:uncharacterized protein LOC122589476 [Erigeron canadensis]